MVTSYKKFNKTEIQVLKRALTIAKKNLKLESTLERSKITNGIANIRDDFGIK